jgi:hypothetical protein
MALFGSSALFNALDPNKSKRRYGRNTNTKHAKDVSKSCCRIKEGRLNGNIEFTHMKQWRLNL